MPGSPAATPGPSEAIALVEPARPPPVNAAKRHHFDAWLADPPKPEPEPPRDWFFVADAGPSYQRIYATSIYGGRFALAADVELPLASVTIGASFAYGELDTGLHATQLELGPACDIRLGRARIGAGIGMGFMTISTVTSDPTSTAVTFDFDVHGTLDVAALGTEKRSAVFVGLQARGSLVLVSDATLVVWGPGAFAGVRL